MSNVQIKLTAVLITHTNGKRSQQSKKCHCPACGCARFNRMKRKGRYIRMTCSGCGRHLSVGLVVCEAVTE